MYCYGEDFSNENEIEKIIADYQIKLKEKTKGKEEKEENDTVKNNNTF